MEKRFFSIRQAAEFSTLSTRKLYQACQDRKIKHFKVEKRIIISQEDLEEYLTKNPIEIIDWEDRAEQLR